MKTTAYSRRRADAERARKTRATKRQKLAAGVAIPDSRDVDVALAETMARALRDVAMPRSRLARCAVGVLVRNGFDRAAARAAVKASLERSFDGPDPANFALFARGDVWADFERERATAAETVVETRCDESVIFSTLTQ